MLVECSAAQEHIPALDGDFGVQRIVETVQRIAYVRQDIFRNRDLLLFQNAVAVLYQHPDDVALLNGSAPGLPAGLAGLHREGWWLVGREIRVGGHGWHLGGPLLAGHERPGVAGSARLSGCFLFLFTDASGNDPVQFCRQGLLCHLH